MISYSHPDKVSPSKVNNQPVLTSQQGGKIAVDEKLLELWEIADGREIEEIIRDCGPGSPENEILAGLACLAEAGLLDRAPKDKLEMRIDAVSPGPLVSAIIVAHNSLEWLPVCLASLDNQNYQPFEVVIVDNGSSDGTDAWVAENYPQVKYQYLQEPVSFARAINLGVDASAGDSLLLLNPDTELDSNAISEMVRVTRENPKCAAASPKIKLMSAPEFLNGIGNRVDAFSWGVDNGLGHLDLNQFDSWDELPSACFAAALVPRQAWEDAGSADEKFPMYYEDSEWSYRARKKGFIIRAAPKAIVYHAFGGRIPGGANYRLGDKKLEHVVYGRLRFASKLLDDKLPDYLLSYLVSDLINFFRFLFTLNFGSIAAIMQGYFRYFGDFSEIRDQRKRLRNRQVIRDKSIFSLQREMPETNMWKGLPELTWDLINNTYLPAVRAGKTRPLPEFAGQKGQPKLLIISHDVIDERMAGPGMRYMELGRALAKEIEVTIVVPNTPGLNIPQINLRTYSEYKPQDLRDLVDSNDFVLVSSYLVNRFPFLRQSKARIIVDLYDPFVLENLHFYSDEPLTSQESLNQQSVDYTNQLARVGDFFICGNERQRDFWLGVLTSNGRVNPRNYNADPQFRSLIDVVGIGFPDRPINSSQLVKGVHPSVPEDAKIVLWGGGVWNWLDPITLIKAWPAVHSKFQQSRLVILGTRHPNPDIPMHKMAEQAQSLAQEIGEMDESIIFLEWLSYRDREALLSEADVGVSLHPIHIETRYSIRTRVMDYVWARLPILSTEGDITSEWISEYGLGRVVPANDVKAVENGLIELLGRSKASWSPQFDTFRAAFHWESVAAPLKNYCLSGGYAPDRLERTVSSGENVSMGRRWGQLWGRTKFIFRTAGTRGVTHRAWRYVQREIANL